MWRLFGGGKNEFNVGQKVSADIGGNVIITGVIVREEWGKYVVKLDNPVVVHGNKFTEIHFDAEELTKI